jgi:hypothetical protein
VSHSVWVRCEFVDYSETANSASDHSCRSSETLFYQHSMPDILTSFDVGIHWYPREWSLVRENGGGRIVVRPCLEFRNGSGSQGGLQLSKG